MFQILVVDDEPSVLRAVNLLLSLDGHEVSTVTSGAAALALLEQSQFDLVITDYSMVEMKGDQLATHIKARWPEQPILMATAFADEFNEHGKSAGGADYVLSKPFSRGELCAAIDRVLL
jgi:CheY-like chemotaxis protein